MASLSFAVLASLCPGFLVCCFPYSCLTAPEVDSVGFVRSRCKVKKDMEGLSFRGEGFCRASWASTGQREGFKRTSCVKIGARQGMRVADYSTLRIGTIG